jgi:hypothetical protein
MSAKLLAQEQGEPAPLTKRTCIGFHAAMEFAPELMCDSLMDKVGIKQLHVSA